MTMTEMDPGADGYQISTPAVKRELHAFMIFAALSCSTVALATLAVAAFASVSVFPLIAVFVAARGVALRYAASAGASVSAPNPQSVKLESCPGRMATRG